MADAPHYLVITEPAPGEREYAIEHDPRCPFEEADSGLGDGPAVVVRYYTCAVGAQETAIGVEYALEDISELAPGRYPIRAEHSHAASTPNGPAEWDSWLVIDDEVARG